MKLKIKTFKKGLVLPDHKYRSLSSTKISSSAPVHSIELLLIQSGGLTLKPCVQVGDLVSIGTVVADASETGSVPLHASVSGRVREIKTESIVIDSDGADRIDTSIRLPQTPAQESANILDAIYRAGIADLGGSDTPTHIQIEAARMQNVRTLIVSGCESEPFLTADHTLMLNYPTEVLKGIELLRIASGAERAVLAVERNKMEVIETINSKNYNLKFYYIHTMALPVRYPQGSERVLAETFLGRPLAKNETPLSKGILVQHVATAFAVYEAVYLGKPLYERVVTVSGPCVMDPKNIWTRIGTPVGDLIRMAKGFLRNPERVVLGGPMTGEAIAHLNVPVTQKVSGILALSKELAFSRNEQPCTRCGLCVDVCPESLMPETLMRAVKKENHALAQEFDLAACTECGLCDYICPSEIPLVDLFRSGKTKLISAPVQDDSFYDVPAQAKV